MISYKYGKCIGQSLFNYNTVLHSLVNTSTKSLTCECATNTDLKPFVYQLHGHVHTGKLDFITHAGLRSLMIRGSNFRETPFVKSSRYLFVLKGYIKKFLAKWAKKEKIPPNEFDNWFHLLINFIKSKLKSIDLSVNKEF